jgi:hypothetical protein
MRAHPGHFLPGDPDATATADPGRDSAKHSSPGTPHRGTAEDRYDLELFTGSPLERQIVDLPAASVL